MYKNLSQLFLEHDYDDKILFLNKTESITLSQFRQDILNYITGIKHFKDDTIALYIPNNQYLFYVLFIALFQANKNIVLPSYVTDYTQEDLNKLTSVIITDSDINCTSIQKIDPLDLKTEKYPQIALFTPQNIHFFTSGSTGKPKCITKTLDSLLAEVEMHSEIQKLLIQKDSVVVSSILPYHIYGMLWRFLFPLCNFLKEDLETVSYPEEIQEKQRLNDSIILLTTPAFMSELSCYKQQYTFKKNCVGIFSSGSLLSQNVSEEMFQLFGVSPYEIFGSSETGGVAYRQQKKDPYWHLFSKVHVTTDKNSCLVVESKFAQKGVYTMSDSVQMLDKNTFILNGRTDRLVKIAEKRIDLSDMENKINQFGLISESHMISMDTEKRTILVAFLKLNDLGKEFILSQGKNLFSKELKNYLKKWYEPVVLPRRIRILEKFPKNKQGKFIGKEFENLAISKCQEPIMKSVKYNKNTFEGDFCFLKDSIYFQGHFPDFPILPGVIQLHFVFYILKYYFSVVPQKYSLLKLKFMNLIVPQQFVHLSIENILSENISFKYYQGDKVYSSGIIRIENNEK